MFDVLSRLKELQDAKGVSSYRLDKISDTPKSTLSGWRSAKRPPGIKKLEQICTDVLGISLAQFFDKDNELALTPEETLLLGNYRKLAPEVQKALQIHTEYLAAVPGCCSRPDEATEPKADTVCPAAAPAAPAAASAKKPSVLKVAERPDPSHSAAGSRSEKP